MKQKHLSANSQRHSLGRTLRPDAQLLLLPSTLQWDHQENPNVSLDRPRLNLLLKHISVTAKALRTTRLTDLSLEGVLEGNKMYSSYLRPPMWWFCHYKRDDKIVFQKPKASQSHATDQAPPATTKKLRLKS